MIWGLICFVISGFVSERCGGSLPIFFAMVIGLGVLGIFLGVDYNSAVAYWE